MLESAKKKLIAESLLSKMASSGVHFFWHE